MKRWLLLAFCVLFLAQEALTIPLTAKNVGVMGALPNGRAAPFAWRLLTVPDSAATAAGVHDGDVVDARALDSVHRFRLWSEAPVAGVPFTLPLIRGGVVHPVTVTPANEPLTWDLWVAIIAGFWSGICAIVMVARGSGVRSVRILVLYLLLVRLSIQMNPTNWVTAYPILDLINAMLAEATPIGWALLASFVASYAPRENRTVRALVWVSYALAAYIAAIGVIAAAGAWFGGIDSEAPIFAGVPYFVAQLAYLAAPIACAVVVLRSIRGVDRARLAWLLGPTVVLYLVYLSYVATSYVPFFNTGGFITFSLLIQLLAPIGMSYAILNRRLLDIGFALNRAVAYTALSLVIVSIFVLFEFALTELFKSITHTEDIVANAGLALALGLSIRTIHSRVDVVLDRVFFRKRHENEAALRRFGREAPYITDAGTLLARAALCVEKHADASSVVFALDNGSGRYGDVDENDPALVSLRAFGKVVDLQRANSALSGERAYPLVARGRLLGALVLGPRRSGETYAPDESAAVEELAYGVASSLDALMGNERSREDAILAGIQALSREVEELRTVYTLTRGGEKDGG